MVSNSTSNDWLQSKKRNRTHTAWFQLKQHTILPSFKSIKSCRIFFCGSSYFSLSDMSDKRPLKDIPNQIKNPRNGCVLLKGKFLGKGGFARCYELIEDATGTIYAGKIISKTLLAKKAQRDKVSNTLMIFNSSGMLRCSFLRIRFICFDWKVSFFLCFW